MPIKPPIDIDPIDPIIELVDNSAYPISDVDGDPISDIYEIIPVTDVKEII